MRQRAPAACARSAASRIRRALPGRSPTVWLSCAIANFMMPMLAFRLSPFVSAVVSLSSPVYSVVRSLSGIDPAQWNALVGDQPLLSHAFLHALHETGCASAATGWDPHYII